MTFSSSGTSKENTFPLIARELLTSIFPDFDPTTFNVSVFSIIFSPMVSSIRIVEAFFSISNPLEFTVTVYTISGAVFSSYTPLFCNAVFVIFCVADEVLVMPPYSTAAVFVKVFSELLNRKSLSVTLVVRVIVINASKSLEATSLLRFMVTVCPLALCSIVVPLALVPLPVISAFINSTPSGKVSVTTASPFILPVTFTVMYQVISPVLLL